MPSECSLNYDGLGEATIYKTWTHLQVRRSLQVHSVCTHLGPVTETLLEVTWCDFVTAPEVQTSSVCSVLSDMFSLGMVICAIFNHGRPLIQANHSSSTYLKQIELVRDFYNYIDFNEISNTLFCQYRSWEHRLPALLGALYQAVIAIASASQATQKFALDGNSFVPKTVAIKMLPELKDVRS